MLLLNEGEILGQIV